VKAVAEQRTLRILTILARYGTEAYPEADAQLDELLRRLLPGVTRELLIVDNALPRTTVAQSGGRTLLGGDNRVWEFSAFDRAVEWLGPTLDDYDYIHFATSAFNELYTGYLERFTLGVLRAGITRSLCIGHIDCYNEPIRISSHVSQHWVRTAFFVLPPSVVSALGSFVSIADGGRLFSGRPMDPFEPTAPISENYRRYVVGWLCGDDIGQGVRWHSRLALTPESLTRFEQKALAIVNEHMLAIRLRAMGCCLADVTWLSGAVTRMPVEDIPWNLSWRDQIATRDPDRLVMETR
jgi:hypothetical protein